MLETLDFETLEKLQKSLEMIDSTFGGNVTMKKTVLTTYGLSLDDFPTVFLTGKEDAFESEGEDEANKNASLKLQNKLVYGDKWFVLQNRLLNAITNLNLNERRLIMFLSPLIRKDVDKYPQKYRRVFTVKALDFARRYEIDDGNVYRILESSAHSILNKSFHFWNFKEDQRTYQTGSSWVDFCDYKKDLGCLDISLSSHVVEMITVFDKANSFTKYEHEVIVKLGSYGIILFELIASCMHQEHKQKTYTIQYLREKFNCLETYLPYYDFRRYVIDRAIKDIHDHTSYRIKYEQKKSGRIVSELTFSFEDNSKKLENKDKNKNGTRAIKRDADNGDMFTIEGLSDKQLGRITRNPSFIADYNHLVSSTSAAGQDTNDWESEMTKRLKKDSSQFKKRPIRYYLDY
uniref:replication initiation protein n=1 Tax=Psychrobacter sp. TaxID=56811 RepID=UPI00159833DC|nr:replication initiation protein [Psychrobacter sp.]QJS05077.1 replication protein, Rep3 superfamily [Psychrobacter sp.]